MNKNWDQLIENYYGQKKTLNLSTLEQLVSEVMDNMRDVILVMKNIGTQIILKNGIGVLVVLLKFFLIYFQIQI